MTKEKISGSNMLQEQKASGDSIIQSLPRSPRELDLPFNHWRANQADIVEQIVNSDKKFVILQAPTGIGKSLISVAAAKLETTKQPGYIRGGEGRSIFLCKTKQLQTQYLDANPNLKVLKGKGNFTCRVFPEMDCSMAPCAFITNTDDQRKCLSCEYRLQMRAAKNAKEVVTNYSMYMALHKYVGKEWRQADFVTCDEAHLLEPELAKFSSIYLSKKVLESHGANYPGDTVEINPWKWWASIAKNKFEAQAIRLESDIASEVQAGNTPDPGLIAMYASYKRLFEASKALLRADDSWIGVDNRSHFLFSPVWVNEFSKNFFFGHKKVLLMSATILDPDLFAKFLGISEDEFTFIDMPAVFDKKNRPIYYVPVAKMSYHQMGEALPKVTAAIDFLIESHWNEKGIIHAHNYTVAKYIVENSRHRDKLLTHDIFNRESVLDAFKQSGAPAVLVSPSMGTGVSLDYDLARYCIIPKVPFPDQGDKMISKKMHTDNTGKWYAYKTVADIVQATGRIVRAPDDYGTSYILDSNFGWFHKQNKSLFPAWWEEALEVRKL